MADKTIEQRVKEIVVEQLGVNADQVSPEAKFIEDLGADSLDTVELVMALEEEFGHEIPDEQAETLRHVRDAPFGMSGVTLGQKLNISRQSAWERLDILVEKGVAIKRMGKVYAK